MGLAGLTAVFGMGTGGAPPVSSPEGGRGVAKLARSRVQAGRRDVVEQVERRRTTVCIITKTWIFTDAFRRGDTGRVGLLAKGGPAGVEVMAGPGCFWLRKRRRVGVVKPFGC